MPKIEKREAQGFGKCTCCGETWRRCEKFIQVVSRDGKAIRSERYCINCESYAMQNNDIDEDDDGERHLRQAEAYGAYVAAGSREAYWTDRDAGLVD